MSLNVVTFAPTVPTVPKGPPAHARVLPVQRSILNPVSLLELSVQARSTR